MHGFQSCQPKPLVFTGAYKNITASIYVSHLRLWHLFGHLDPVSVMQDILSIGFISSKSAVDQQQTYVFFRFVTEGLNRLNKMMKAVRVNEYSDRAYATRMSGKAAQ